MKFIITGFLSVILWLGLAPTDGPFGLGFGPDQAVAGNNGNGGNSGGSKSDKANGNKGKTSNQDKVKTQSLHAELKGLNSLNRNINGLLNSSDPKMDAFRDLVNADAEPSEQELQDAIEVALGEPEPAAGWSAELKSWVDERVTELRNARIEKDGAVTP